MKKRIVTRPDFDGIVCAVLLTRAEDVQKEILWIEPHDVQSGKARILPGDILANLPYSPECTLWFDHHVSNRPAGDIPGAFDIAPSAAGVVYRYYRDKGKLDNRFDELVLNTDIIDAADLTQDQVRYPEKYPYIVLSMTIRNQGDGDSPYWNRLVRLLGEMPINDIVQDPDIKDRCQQVVEENIAYKTHLMANTQIQDQISITDFRSFDRVPDGNRFLTYCLFPDSIASVKIRYDSPKKEHVLISIGRSIFNPGCHVNIGKLLSRFGGGGHAGAGGCTLKAETADRDINAILDILFQNKPDG